MKTIVKYALVAMMLMAFFYGNVSAQTVNFINDSDIPEDEIIDAQNRVLDKVSDFVKALEKLTCTDCGYSIETKKTICSDALTLFMGEGDPYPIKVEDRDGNYREVTAPAVIMEFIQSKWNQKKFSRKTKDYLKGLVKMPVVGKQRVKIGLADAIRIDNINKVSDSLFMAVVTIKIRTIRLNESESKIIYTDDTEKKIQVFMQRIEEEAPIGGKRVRWIIKLGDIHAVSVE